MSKSLYRDAVRLTRRIGNKVLEIRRGVFILMTKFYQEPGMSTQAKIQLLYPDVRLKPQDYLISSFILWFLDYVQGR